MDSQLIILGLGARSTLFYQKTLHNLYLKKHKNYATCPFILKQLNFNTINPHLPDGTEIIKPIIENELQEYNRFNSYLIVPNITIHNILNTINFKLNIIHPIKILENKLVESKLKKFVIFGTRHSKNLPNLTTALKKNNKDLVEVKNDHIQFLDKLRQDVYNNSEIETDVKKFHSLLNIYTSKYGVIIACTELSVINSTKNLAVLDLVKLQCKEAIKII